MSRVAVLFARRDSIYKSFIECDVYDAERNALTWPGGCPVIAHPPCRLWGRLKHFARSPDPEAEKNYALWAVKQVQTWGGVLEHPAGSSLWQEANLPMPGTRDEHGGFCMLAPQWWWGHRAEKLTFLYIVGLHWNQLPLVPFRTGKPEHVVTTCKRKGEKGWMPRILLAEREQTPIEFAKWLINVAQLTAAQTAIYKGAITGLLGK